MEGKRAVGLWWGCQSNDVQAQLRVDKGRDGPGDKERQEEITVIDG